MIPKILWKKPLNKHRIIALLAPYEINVPRKQKFQLWTPRSTYRSYAVHFTRLKNSKNFPSWPQFVTRRQRDLPISCTASLLVVKGSGMLASWKQPARLRKCGGKAEHIRQQHWPTHGPMYILDQRRHRQRRFMPTSSRPFGTMPLAHCPANFATALGLFKKVSHRHCSCSQWSRAKSIERTRQSAITVKLPKKRSSGVT